MDDDGDTVETSFTSEEATNFFFNEVSGANAYEEEYIGRTVIISTFCRNDYGNETDLSIITKCHSLLPTYVSTEWHRYSDSASKLQCIYTKI